MGGSTGGRRGRGRRGPAVLPGPLTLHGVPRTRSDRERFDLLVLDAVSAMLEQWPEELREVEFAVEDGIPYAIDFMNPAPDADLHSVGPANFEWIVSAVAELAVKKAAEPPAAPEYRWAAMLKVR